MKLFKLNPEKHNEQQTKSQYALVDLLFILFVSLSLAFIMTVTINTIPEKPLLGTPASTDIRADRNYEIVNEELTRKQKDESTVSVLPVYDFNPSVSTETIKRVKVAFEAARSYLSEKIVNDEVNSEVNLSPDQEEDLKREFLGRINFNLTTEQYALIRQHRFNHSIEGLITYLLDQVLILPVVSRLEDMRAPLSKGIVLRMLSPEEKFPEEIIHDPALFQDLESIAKKINLLDLSKLIHESNLEFLDKDDVALLRGIALSLVTINTSYSASETDFRRKNAQTNIKDVIMKISAGEMIIRRGELYSPWHVSVIEGMMKQKLKGSFILKLTGMFLFVNLVLFVVYYLSTRYLRKFHPKRKDLIFLGVNLILFIGLLRFGVFLGSSVINSLTYNISSSALYYLLPVSAGAMLARFILNTETAFIFAVIISLFAGFFLQNSLELTVYYLISGIFSAHVIGRVDKRSSVLLCGLYTGGVNFLAILSLNLISLISVDSAVPPTEIMLNLVSGIVGGIFSAMTVLVLSPIIETVFNYTSDIKLLELASLSHPLLKEMIVRAPGTYHHSQLVGILSEAGAQSVGANQLLARVASYYHDIGKMKKPTYFIENQRGEGNPHDKLNPSMSALIIESHVKDGLDMAKEYKLPQKITDMIPQHQGTKLMGFFYNKAKNQNPGVAIDDKDYRYPGPKPQSREAGIIMLADAVEAAVRSLSDKTPARIRSTVEKIINHHFVDEQLDECDLTLRDIHQIAQAFVSILTGIYHQRVEYPEGALALPQKNDHPSEQYSPNISNVAPLFRKKD